MDRFEGFYTQTNDYLIGIRFNNYKEWFHAHKDEYARYVQQPMKLFADEIFAAMLDIDGDFAETPKISRANRDIRFSKNKNPYKESKWFFLRADGSPHLTYVKPTFFFEVAVEGWRYGFFFAPGPSGMAEYRKAIEADEAGFERLVKNIEKKKFFTVEGDEYKRKYNADISDKIMPYYQKKGICFTRYEDYANTAVYGRELIDIVTAGFKELYPMYKFCEKISKNLMK